MNKAVLLILIFALIFLVSCTEKQVKIENKEYCNQAQRNIEFCYTLYEPVCGYSEEKQIQTYDNICNACKNPEVSYFVRGEC